MKERPILFNAPMVRAILEGRKTQTRRAVKNLEGRPATSWTMHQAAGCADSWSSDSGWMGRCPYGQPGDRLWVREAWAPEQYDADATTVQAVDSSVRKPAYRADFHGNPAYKWRPSIHMPRRSSRIQLEVLSVRVERLNDISEADARAEGCEVQAIIYPDEPRSAYIYVEQYRVLWESINGPGSWEANPWVWVVEFKRVQQGGAA